MRTTRSTEGFSVPRSPARKVPGFHHPTCRPLRLLVTSSTTESHVYLLRGDSGSHTKPIRYVVYGFFTTTGNRNVKGSETGCGTGTGLGVGLRLGLGLGKRLGLGLKLGGQLGIGVGPDGK